MQPEKVDFLVIGSGIAGLSFALKAARHGKVMVITKADEDESNTKYAQGGIAVVTDSDDSFEKHIQDTLTAGDGLCNEEVVKMVVSEAPARIRDIINWGTSFDKTESGTYDLAKEGGHSESRILHHKDVTGLEIERNLLKQIHANPNIELHSHYFAVDIITQHHLGEEVTRRRPDTKCYGAYVLNMSTNLIETILSKVTLMATGGAGNAYMATTNPRIATGDGVAMAYRAKATIENMEFVQFHPTALYNPGDRPNFLISEAVRGFGGILKTKSGVEFMDKYDSRKSLAPRDIVARSIDRELKKSGDEYVYLDCKHLNAEDFIKHFPNIHQKCLSIGIDFRKGMIPVVPAAHYNCGGIAVNKHAQSTINYLYAMGECSFTGLHGANRLASNSLLEAAVYSHNAFLHSRDLIDNIAYADGVPEWDDEGTKQQNENILITQNQRELQAIMSNYVGIVRSNERLSRALHRLSIIYEESEMLYKKTNISPPVCELRNLINVSYLMVKGAMNRKENKGLHYNLDLQTTE
jgi:L-aspartate oxidase